MTTTKWQVQGSTVYTLGEDGTNHLSAQVQNYRSATYDESLAAAKLFAAAPALLEALEAAIRDQEDFEDGRLSGNTVASIRAAIKLTRGEP